MIQELGSLLHQRRNLSVADLRGNLAGIGKDAGVVRVDGVGMLIEVALQLNQRLPYHRLLFRQLFETYLGLESLGLYLPQRFRLAGEMFLGEVQLLEGLYIPYQVHHPFDLLIGLLNGGPHRLGLIA